MAALPPRRMPALPPRLNFSDIRTGTKSPAAARRVVHRLREHYPTPPRAAREPTSPLSTSRSHPEEITREDDAESHASSAASDDGEASDCGPPSKPSVLSAAERISCAAKMETLVGPAAAARRACADREASLIADLDSFEQYATAAMGRASAAEEGRQKAHQQSLRCVEDCIAAAKRRRTPTRARSKQRTVAADSSDMRPPPAGTDPLGFENAPTSTSIPVSPDIGGADLVPNDTFAALRSNDTFANLRQDMLRDLLPEPNAPEPAPSKGKTAPDTAEYSLL